MTAVVEIAGVQYEVEQNIKLTVPRLAGNPGDVVEFGNILLSSDDGNTKVGNPYIDGKVQATIIDHGKDKTVLVFHKKRRKGYRKLNGHRAKYTQIEITNININ